MIASPRAASQFTAAAQAVAIHGDALWNALCDTMPIDKPFTIDQACDAIDYPLSRSTKRQYIRAVLISVMDEGYGVARRITPRYWAI